MQPYRRDPDIVQFHASGRAGRRNAVTEDELLAIAAVVAQFASRTDDDDDDTVSVAGAVSDQASCETRDTQTDDASTVSVYDTASGASTGTVYDTVSEHSSSTTKTAETRDAGLPADVSKLKLAGENL